MSPIQDVPLTVVGQHGGSQVGLDFVALALETIDNVF
jgi:hypothetical protein